MKHFPQIASRVFNRPLAIAPSSLEPVTAYVSARIAGRPAAGIEAAADDELDPDALAPYLTDDGIYVIPVQGTLVHRSSWLDAYCGLRGYGSLEADLIEAVNSPARGILLLFDSPGGEVSGMFHAGEVLAAVAAAKPVFAAVDDMACSAAYFLAAHVERIFITRTAMVGSIGVIAQHVDQSAYDAEMGLKFTPIYAGAKKNDLSPHEPLKKGAKAELQAEIDRIYGLFVDAVASERGITPEAARAQEAGVYTAQAAIDAGLADEIGEPDDAYEALLARVSAAPTAAAGTVARKENSMKMGSLAAKLGIKKNAKGSGTEPPAEETEQPAAEPDEEEGEEQQEPEAPAPPVEGRPNAAAREIAALCKIFGEPGLAADYIAAGKTLAEVRGDLLKKRSTTHQVSSMVTPATGTRTGFDATDPNQNPMLAAARKTAQAMKKGA